MRPDELLVQPGDFDRVRKALGTVEQGLGLRWHPERDEKPDPGAPPVKFRLQRKASTAGLGAAAVNETTSRVRAELGRRDVVFPNYVLSVPEIGTVVEFAPQPRYQGDAPPRPAVRPSQAELEKRGEPGKAGREVTIGIVDSGISPDDRWLEGAGILHDDDDHERPDDYAPEGVLDPVAGHGTFIAGQFLQDCPEATLACVRVFRENGLVSDTDLVEGIDRLVERVGKGKLDVLNLSLAARTQGDEPPPALARRLRELRAEGVAIVAAAGNGGAARLTWPAAAKDVIAVGALDAGDAVASYSDYGYWVDVLARGDAESAFFTFGDFKGWAAWEGTSFAAPRVSARIAREAMEHGGSGVDAAFRLLEQLQREKLEAEHLARPRFPVAQILPDETD